MTDNNLFGADLYNPQGSSLETPYTAHRAELQAEAQRLASAKARILARLQRGPATNVELAGICLRYTGRMSDLRLQDGYQIEKDLVAPGVWRYTLTGRVDSAGREA